MKKYIVVSPTDDGISELEKNNRRLAKDVATEGFVLLHNNGVLPLKDKQVALFGTGARMTVFGGTGSGETKGRGKITIEQGLLNAGVEIESNLWMDEFDAKYEREYKAWRDELEEHIKGYHLWNVMDMFTEIYKHHFAFPVGDEITDRHVMGDSDVAIYIIARQAGEGGDRRLEAGDYYLSELELHSIKFLKRVYKKVVVLINSGASVDCSFMDNEETRPDALMYIGQPGEETGNAVADVLYGKVSPSGRLTATWARDYYDYPSADKYVYMVENKLEANYTEGRYVGYRWFDNKGISSRYHFGYGLSYTEFEQEFVSAVQEKDKLILFFNVRNIGSTYSGKDVVQIYVSKPDASVEQVKRELVAFEKTPNIAPGSDVNISVEVALKDLRSYVEDGKYWCLLAGEYEFYVGTSDGAANQSVYRMEIIEDEIDGNKIENQDDVKLSRLVQDLTDDELCTMLAGGPVTSYGYVRTPGSVGKTSNILWDKYGVPNINMADGPAGLNLISQSLITKRGLEKSYMHLPDNWSYGFLKKMEWLAVGNPKKDRMVCQYTTAFPSTTVRTQTWNKELIYKVGDAVGKEMKKYGITLWLAPAINIQRNPLCGRNFEYASEDPILSGYMAAAIIKGVQDNGGVGAVIKHFCANNQETEREYMSSNIDDRTLREIYLKGFEIAIRESNPWAVMTSYNKLNGEYTANNRELLEKILRGEWNYQGVVMTDWGAITDKKGDYYKCANCGNDLIMPGDKGVVNQLKEDLKAGRLDRKVAMRSVDRIISMVKRSKFV